MPGIILSTAYLPPILYVKQLAKNKVALIDQYENYVKQTYRTRCVIYGPNGTLTLSVPTIKHKNHTSIKEIKISTAYTWQRMHWHSIETAYNSSPFFMYYKDDLFSLLNKRYIYLLDLNCTLLDYIIDQLNIKCRYKLTETYPEKPNNDLRNFLSPKKTADQLLTPYYQVFQEKNGFISNLSIIDLLFNLGPDALSYLKDEKH